MDYRRRHLILDTGPLLTFLLVKFLQEISANNAVCEHALKEIRGTAWDVNRQQQLQRVIETGAVMTTSHVIAEALHLRKHSFLNERRDKFTPYAVEKLRTIEERSVLIKDLPPEAVLHFGLTDASLLWLVDHENATLLTDDKPIFQAQRSPRGEIRLTEEYLAAPYFPA